MLEHTAHDAGDAAPALSLVVGTVDRFRDVEYLFRSLDRQRCRDFEVVLVDQSGGDGLASIVAEFSEKFPIRHVSPPRGLSRARNVGLKQCRGSIFGFPDDDCWYDPDVVETVTTFFRRRSDVSILTGRTLDAKGTESLAIYLAQSGPIERRNVFQAGTSNALFVRRDAALAVGGFDEDLGVGSNTPYLSGEETDFILRVLARGGSGWFEHRLWVRHPQKLAGSEDGVKRSGDYARGFGRLLRLHNYGAMFLGTRVARASLKGMYKLATGDIAGARASFYWVAGSLRGYAGRSDSPR